MTINDTFGLRSLHRYDIKYRLNDLRGCAAPGTVLYRPGTTRAIFSAPHSITQVRNGSEKRAEFFTGAIAEYLAEELNAHAVTSLAGRAESPNAGSPDQYRTVLEMALRSTELNTFVDLHGMSDRYGLDVCVGLAGREMDRHTTNLLTVLESRFRVGVNKPFGGSGSLAAWVNRQFPNVVGIQIELSTLLRRDVVHSEDMECFVTALQGFTTRHD